MFWYRYGRQASSPEELARMLKDAIDRGELMTAPGELNPEQKETLENHLRELLKNKFQYTGLNPAIQKFLDNMFGAESSAALQRLDPLALDLDGDGVELVHVNNSTAFFDLDLKEVASLSAANDIKNNPQNANYNPNALIYTSSKIDAQGNNITTYYIGDGLKEKVGWVKGDDGLLVLDRNNNNEVDNILELFGKANKTGTEELREYDLNNDGVINSSDAVFSKLQIWRDLNQNGVSEASELKKLSDLNIASIDLNNLDTSIVETMQFDPNRNHTISIGTYTKLDGKVLKYENLDLAINQSNSVSYDYVDENGNEVGDYDLNLDVLTLPFIRGYGNVEALPIAASKNSELLKSLKELRDLDYISYNKIDSLVAKIIYQWSGTNSLSESSLRGNFSGIKLAVMENFRG